MQQALIGNNLNHFESELNHHLMNGWRVVPGTMYVGSQRLAATKTTPEWFRLADGSTFYKVFFVVLENDEKTPTPPATLQGPEANHDHPPSAHVYAQFGD